MSAPPVKPKISQGVRDLVAVLAEDGASVPELIQLVRLSMTDGCAHMRDVMRAAIKRGQ